MKQKINNQRFLSILTHSAFICSLLFFSFIFFHYQTYADATTPGTAGYPCVNELSCNRGLSCSGSIKQCGTSCTKPADCTTAGTYCDLTLTPGACITGTALNGVQPTPSPANPTPPATPITCPTDLTPVNGLCLPPSQYTTGIAGSTTLSGFIITIIKILLSFAGIIAVVMLVIGGYWYMAAGGNEETAEKGKKTIINFVLGLVVIILAYTIVTIIAATLTGADKLLQ
jgi:uncharacterized membrane protein YwzB